MAEHPGSESGNSPIKFQLGGKTVSQLEVTGSSSGSGAASGA